MGSYDPRSYSGAAQDTTLTAPITSVSLTATVTDATGYPSANFVVILDRGTASEEKRLVESRTGNQFTFAVAGLGYDGTAALDHAAGATVGHVWDARSAQEANDTAVNTLGRVTSKGDLIAGTGVHTLDRVPVGASGMPLQANPAAATGVSWGALTQAVTHASPDTDTAPTALHHTLGTTANKAAAGNHTHDGSGGYTQTVPAGSVTMFAGAAAPAGYLLCDGTAVSRTTYAGLFAAIGTTYGAGDGSTTFNVPNLKGRVPIGLDSTQASFDTLGETGGANTVALTEAQLPAHTHSINHGHGSTDAGGGHSHTLGLQYNSVTPNTGANIRVTDIDGQTGGSGTVATANTGAVANHSHTIAGYVGNSGAGNGTAAPVSVVQPYLTLTFIVKT